LVQGLSLSFGTDDTVAETPPCMASDKRPRRTKQRRQPCDCLRSLASGNANTPHVEVGRDGVRGLAIVRMSDSGPSPIWLGAIRNRYRSSSARSHALSTHCDIVTPSTAAASMMALLTSTGHRTNICESLRDLPLRLVRAFQTVDVATPSRLAMTASTSSE